MEFNERYYIWENGLWKRRIDKIERFQQNTEKIENAINETLNRQQQPLFDYDWSSIQNYNPVTNNQIYKKRHDLCNLLFHNPYFGTPHIFLVALSALSWYHHYRTTVRLEE